ATRCPCARADVARNSQSWCNSALAGRRPKSSVAWFGILRHRGRARRRFSVAVAPSAIRCEGDRRRHGRLNGSIISRCGQKHRPYPPGLVTAALIPSRPASKTLSRHANMIVLIDNYDSFTFNLFHYLGGLGADVVVHRNDKISTEQVIAMEPEAVVLSPGPCT